MDNVGKYELPNVISSLYFDQVPSSGGETLFANLLNSYAKIKNTDKIDFNNLIGNYENSCVDIINNIYAPNGFRRLNTIIPQNIIKTPLIFYPYSKYSVKSILFSPVRFINFDKYDEESSWDIMDYIFNKYINIPENVVSIKWSKDDLVIFNNRLLLHTSTPTEIYHHQDRNFKLVFLNTCQKI
jgi:alpha-ketoglutarate-dependent taurine dioxygenase